MTVQPDDFFRIQLHVRTCLHGFLDAASVLKFCPVVSISIKISSVALLDLQSSLPPPHPTHILCPPVPHPLPPPYLPNPRPFSLGFKPQYALQQRQSPANCHLRRQHCRNPSKDKSQVCMSSIGQHLLLSTANFQNADKVLPLAIQERCFAAMLCCRC